MKIPKFSRPDILQDVEKSMGYTRGNKLQIYPTNLTTRRQLRAARDCGLWLAAGSSGYLVLSFLLFTSRLLQNSLSAAVARGRFTDCRSMVTCCLSARFSRTNWCCDLSKESINETTRRRIDMPSILYPVVKIVNKFNTIE